MLYELRLVYNADVIFILGVCYMFDDKKKDIFREVPTDKPTDIEIRKDSADDFVKKYGEPQKRGGGDPASSSTSQQERKPKEK